MPVPDETTSAGEVMWDCAMKEAETQLKDAVADVERAVVVVKRAKHRVARLRYALRVFASNKRDGVPWPSGAQAAAQGDDEHAEQPDGVRGGQR